MTYKNAFTPFNFNTCYQPSWSWLTPMNFFIPPVFTKPPSFLTETPRFSSFNYNYTTPWSFPNWLNMDSVFKSNTKSNDYSTSFASMTRSEALEAARNNPNLEHLSGGTGWSISSASFTNDIPYARKGTSDILARVSKQIGEDLVITSALGTKNSPHAKTSSSESHYNEENPKLDIGGGLSHTQAESLRSKLLNTGYFSRVEVEKHGDTAHLDVQIKDSAFKKLDTVA